MNPVLVTLSGQDIIPAVGEDFRQSVRDLRAMGWTDSEIKELVHCQYVTAFGRKYPAIFLGQASAAVGIVSAIAAAVAAAAGGVAAVVSMVRTGKATKQQAIDQSRALASQAEAEAKRQQTIKYSLIAGGSLAAVVVFNKMAKKRRT